MNDNEPILKKTVEVHVTHLEMTRPPRQRFSVPSKPRLAMMRATNIPTHFYRYIYSQVGRPHHWFLRHKMDDPALAELINGEGCHIDILLADGCVAGFYELSLEHMPERVSLEYFGMMPDYHGMGIGKWFLAEALFAAWQYEPSKVSVNTNTLDHPAALPLYQKLGFSPISVSDDTIEIWE
ncbi:MAG: GNAT family N-acetyltransferase [Rhizobiaceae bacterium]|nr:GNAT family N-acetyltransferase [Rhizobiaceae bacterium]